MKPGKEPTLADAAIRDSFRKGSSITKRSAERIAQARRFVLNKEASSFMADLSHASYDTTVFATKVAATERTRQLARLPHSLCWFEYDAKAFRERTNNTYKWAHDVDGNQLAGAEEVVPRIGWLLEQRHDTCFSMSIVTAAEINKIERALVLPFIMGWTTDDSVPPWESLLKKTDKLLQNANGETRSATDSEVATGLLGYQIKQVVIARNPLWYSTIPARDFTGILTEYLGELRFAWALLAAINDIPIGYNHVVASKGFVAKGRYRRFLDHSEITLLLPKGRDPKKVAAHAVAVSRHRAHPVRGHFRENWRKPLSTQCLHIFEQPDKDTLHCTLCHGEKFHVKEHERGDATLGYVQHDYRVDYKKDDPNKPKPER